LEGDYTIRVDAEAKGFNTQLTTFALIAKTPPPPIPSPPPTFWESYGATVTGVVIVLAIVAIAAVYMYARKS
jgi:hypothetical protein